MKLGLLISVIAYTTCLLPCIQRAAVQLKLPWSFYLIPYLFTIYLKVTVRCTIIVHDPWFLNLLDRQAAGSNIRHLVYMHCTVLATSSQYFSRWHFIVRVRFGKSVPKILYITDSAEFCHNNQANGVVLVQGYLKNLRALLILGPTHSLRCFTALIFAVSCTI